MEQHYSVTKVVFSSGASEFNINGAGGALLTLAGGITNNSTSLQTLNVPIALSSSPGINACSGNIALNGVVSGSSQVLSKLGSGTLTLSGASANTFNGGTVVSAGILVLGKSAGVNSLGSGSISITAGALRNDADNQIANAAKMTLSGSGTYNLNSRNEVIDTVELASGSPATAT